MDNQQQPVRLSQRLLSYLVCALVAWQPLLPALAAQITPVSKGTQLDKAANGVPVINIATPNQAGLSHNQYQNYNVGKEGLILNNATGQLNQTQLGGLIQNNPNLKAGREAKAIINEVTGANRTQLQGYTEVAGKAANVMVANPYGITCNGCGFINTPNATLTTGKPTLDAQGNLQALTVSKGTITIEGQGLDASQSDALSIISRATEINAAVHAKDLQVIAGANRVDKNGAATPVAGEGAAPGVAVDTGALGGMYANRIHLVSSEKGVGVNLGNLNARQGDMVLDANGKLTLKNSLTSGALSAQGESLVLNGDHKAGGAVTLKGKQDVTLNAGALVSDDAIAVQGNGQLTLNGSKLTAGKSIQLSGAQIGADKASRADAGGDIALTAQRRLDNAGQLTAGGNLSLSAAQVKNSGALLAKGDQTVNAAALDNRGQIQGSRTLNVTADTLTNSGTMAGASLAATSDTLTNSGTLTGDSLTLTGDTLSNSGELNGSSITAAATAFTNSGKLIGGALSDIRADRLTNSGTLSAKGAARLNVVGPLDNRGDISGGETLDLASGDLLNSGSLLAPQLSLNSGQLTNSGLLQGSRALKLHADTLTNSGTAQGDSLTADAADFANSGELFGGALSDIRADRLSNSGTLSAKGAARMNVAGRLENGGAISGGDTLSLASHDLFNSGSLTAPQLSLNSPQLTNSGLIQGSRALSLNADQLDNLSGGAIASAGDVTLDLPQLNNRGLIKSDAALHLSGDRLTNSGEINAADLDARQTQLENQQGGRLLAQHGMQLQHQQLINDGEVAADTLSARADALRNGGTLQGNQDLTLSGDRLENRGALLSGGQLLLLHNAINNQGSLQGERLSLKTGDWQNSGSALSNGAADLQAATLSNSGKIVGQQGIDLHAGQIDNSGWLVAQALTLQGDLINSGLIQGSDRLSASGDRLANRQGGQMLSAGALGLNAATQIDNQGALQGDTLQLNAQRLQNDGSAHGASGAEAQIGDALINHGSLTSEKSLALQAATMLNQGTLAADRLSLTAPQLTNGGLIQGNSALTLANAQIANQRSGNILSGGPLTLTPDQLDNDGLLQINGALDLTARQLNNGGKITADSMTLHMGDRLNNSGELLAQQQATLNAQTLDNSGAIAARDLTLTADTLHNQGAAQGDDRLEATAQQLDNQRGGTLLSGGQLDLHGERLTNDGALQGDRLAFDAGTLINQGAMTGLAGLTGTVRDQLNNGGSLQSRGDASLSAGTLLNGGKIIADGLTLRGSQLSNNGLWQGSSLLDAQGDSLTTAAGSRTLSGGLLTLSADSLNSDGTLQGGQTQIDADRWQHQGSLLASGGLTASVAGELTNHGDLLSQGAAQLSAQTLTNGGSLLSDGDMTLRGGALNNSGAVQGSSLTIAPAQVTNKGSLIGLHALTLTAQPTAMGRMMLMALAAPARTLTNDGAMLTQGVLTVNGDTVTNNGSWQGQQILLNAQRLSNNGAIQSADGLQLTLADRLDSAAGSKISANGAAALQARTLTNQGQWIAKNLTLRGDTLNNGGDVSGVDGLTVNLNGALTQAQDKTLLTAGKLSLQAASLNNAGRIQGGELEVTSGALDNSGRLQGDRNLLLTLNGRLTNAANGTLVSQNALTLTTPELYNYGLIQGGGTTGINATGLANNTGRLLSGGALTLNTPQLTNGGWLQATQLTVNAANAANTGTLLAQQQGTLTGNSLVNQGSAQGNNLTVNYQQLNNGGTLLGNSQLNVTAAQVSQQAAGRLFSGGNLVLNSNGFDQFGQVVALGDATLRLINGFTNNGTMAAGNRLSVGSNGDLQNQGTLQGQGLTLDAGGALVNNGQLTSGNGDSALSGGRIAMNGSGTLQGGGNISLNSRSDIALDGFTGTLGNLTLSAPGSIVNTALLYAANNLYLYANSIKNQQGDVLAGNSLWMQRDAAGNANAEVVNTSGTIETQNGDITVKTGHLLNERAGFSVDEQPTASDKPAWATGATTVAIPVSWLPSGSYGIYYTEGQRYHGHGDDWYEQVAHYAPYAKADVQKVPVSVKRVTVNPGGNQARISSGRDLNGQTNNLDNFASTILAGRNIALSGDNLNNKTWTEGTTTEYYTYRYAPGVKNPPRPTVSGNSGAPKSSSITYTLDGAPTYETVGSGNIYRGVIQAGGDISANFTNNISNGDTNAYLPGVTSSLPAPALSRLNTLSPLQAQATQALTPVANVSVGSPQWRDRLQNALQQINGGGGLDNGAAAGTALGQYANGHKGKLTLAQAAQLAPVESDSEKLHSWQGTHVDTSAYPLPSGDNGYFVPSSDPGSRYLITINPKLNGLGQLDQSLYGDLYQLLGKQPVTAAPQETRTQFTDEKAFLGSSYLLDRLNVHPDYDYRFLGDAAFDTRYVSNTVINQTGSRYLNGIGSDLEQMRYLMDNAAAAQQSLGLQFGVSLTADQVAGLDHSIIWWEAANVNGETVMVPKVYLSPKDVTMNNGSVIAGNNVKLEAGSITNSGSTLTAQNNLTLDSQNSLSNLNQGLINAGGDLQLSALNDINNVSSTISGKKVALESLDGSINNLTASKQTDIDTGNRWARIGFTQTTLGTTAAIKSLDALSLTAGNDITVKGADVTAGGGLLLNAGNNINVAANDINQAESRSGSLVKNGSTSSISHQGSTLSAGGALVVQAGHDLTLTASTAKAGGSAALLAGNDLNLNAADTQQNSRSGKAETHTSGVDRTTLSSGGDLTLAAGRDLNSQAAALAAEGDVGLQAGRDINLQAEETRTGDSYKAGKKQEINEHVRQQGTEIASGGNTTLQAGRDLNSAATQVTAQQDIAVTAGNNVNLNTATESDYHYKEETKTKKGFLKKKTTHTIEEDSATREAGTLLSGNNVAVTAGNDLLVKGSQVVGDGDVALKAGHDMDIVAATNSDSSWRFKETKKSGLMGSGGIGFTIGSSKSVHDLREKGTTQSQSISTVGSTGGNVSLASGGLTHIGGADLVADQNLSVSGDAVVIEPGHDKRTRDEIFEQKTSGLTLALSGAVGDAVNSAVATAQTAKSESDGRLVALQATKTALSGAQAALTAQQSAVSGEPANVVGVSISLSTQKSKSQQHQTSDTVNGSTLNAGKDLTITANGNGNGAHSGDILIGGSQIKAAGDSTLNATRDILLTGAASTQESSGKNSSSGGGVGVSIGVGSGGANMSIFANVNGAKGKDNGEGTHWNETTLDSGGNVTLNSGRDLTLTGAQVSGNKVTADVGRDLTISSQQDNDRYDSKQTSFGAGGSYGIGTMPVSGYVSISQDKMRSRYDSVQEQSGIFAGKEGFDITTGNHTQLNGAVIASTAEAGKNHLDTGTLGFSDIDNAADYKVSHSGISAGLSSGGPLGGQLLSNALSNTAGMLLAGLGGSGHAEGTTQSAVADGTITIRNQEQQQQNLADLSRDTEHANGSISPIFDKEKEQKRLQMAQMAGEIAGQMSNIVQTYGDIQGLEAAKGAGVKGSATELRDSDAYKAAQRDFGTGGKWQMVTQSVSGILTGLAGGNAAQAAAGGLNPWAAQLIKKETTDANGNVNVAANAMAHAVWGAVAAQMAGGNAAAGAAGAFSGELAARYIAQYRFGADTKEKIAALSEQQRQEVSMMSTLAAGLAGGLAGNSTVAATAGAQAGKNAVENNSLSGEDAQEKNSIELALSKTGLALHPRTPEEVAELEARHEQLIRLDAEIDKYAQDACSQGKTSDACQDANALMQGLKGSYNGYLGQLTYKELNREDYAKVSQIVANTTANKWDFAIEGYAKSKNVSYQEAKDKFALAININQAADVAGILYGLKGPEVNKGAISSAAATLKTVLSKYDEFKQNIAASTKGNNDALAMAGVGNVNLSTAGNNLSSNANLSTGTGGSGTKNLQQLAKAEMDSLAAMYNNKNIHPKDFTVSVNGKTLRTDPEVSIGAPVFKDTTDADVMSYFKQLSGVDTMPKAVVIPGKGTIYSVKVTEGPNAGNNVTLRDFSNSTSQTNARWTIDVKHPDINKGNRVELKFK
ncbi:hemagglutinin repeat-containing protein [Mixta gaviniae]|uniref:Contact-dependent inhibition of growth factor CdiA n=1 Tax=Mixta gaviniae TaxID=665914 RepID=A0A2L0ID96_9GAMM|nr:hemagglutinin repeat-containing protein [Mixta gaviniae]AUX92565.1 Contact-dependent inhibition of growth factor CdiA [Mixta gaviniae]